MRLNRMTDAHKKMHQININKVVDFFGGSKIYARLIGVTASTVYRWQTNRAFIGTEAVLATSLLTSGKYSLKELRPDIAERLKAISKSKTVSI